MQENTDPIARLIHDEKEIILVGTAHVSRESAQLVKTVIEGEKPDSVCVELCPSRYQSIRHKDRWREMDIIKVIKEKRRSSCYQICFWHPFRKESPKNSISIPAKK